MSPAPSVRIHVAVGCGAALGALLRLVVAAGIAPALGLPVWAGTGFVNVAGCFVIGLIAVLSGPGGRLGLAPAGRQLILSGFCGGFTTFSAMSLETLVLSGRNPAAAGGYLAASILLSLAAAWAGYALASRVNRSAI
jgi:CrcB protein